MAGAFPIRIWSRALIVASIFACITVNEIDITLHSESSLFSSREYSFTLRPLRPPPSLRVYGDLWNLRTPRKLATNPRATPRPSPTITVRYAAETLDRRRHPLTFAQSGFRNSPFCHVQPPRCLRAGAGRNTFFHSLRSTRNLQRNVVTADTIDNAMRVSIGVHIRLEGLSESCGLSAVHLQPPQGGTPYGSACLNYLSYKHLSYLSGFQLHLPSFLPSE